MLHVVFVFSLYRIALHHWVEAKQFPAAAATATTTPEAERVSCVQGTCLGGPRELEAEQGELAAAAVDELAEWHEAALHGREFGEAFKRHLTVEEHEGSVKPMRIVGARQQMMGWKLDEGTNLME